MSEHSLQYHFSDFTLKEYEKLLLCLKQHYPVVSYRDALQMNHYAIWRHDLDMSIPSAHRLAVLEYQQGISGQYFVLPHSEFYNLLEKSNTELVREIAAMGHSIQLHFDSAYYQIKDIQQLESALEIEKQLIQDVLGFAVEVFSFHNPSAFDLQCEASHYAGLINTYSSYFKTQVDYCSDSNGYWRHRRLSEVLTNVSSPRLQVLTHPEWWQETIMSPKERVWKSIDERAQSTRDYYIHLLAQNGRKNIDW